MQVGMDRFGDRVLVQMMTLVQALQIIASDTELTAWSVNDYLEALKVVLKSKRVSKQTKAYATGVLQGMLLVIHEVEASNDDV